MLVDKIFYTRVNKNGNDETVLLMDMVDRMGTIAGEISELAREANTLYQQIGIAVKDAEIRAMKEANERKNMGVKK